MIIPPTTVYLPTVDGRAYWSVGDDRLCIAAFLDQLDSDWHTVRLLSTKTIMLFFSLGAEMKPLADLHCLSAISVCLDLCQLILLSYPRGTSEERDI